MGTQSLFAEPAEDLAERTQRIDAQILWLLCGNPGGALDLVLSALEKQVLAAIRYHRGAARAVTIKELQQAWGRGPVGLLPAPVLSDRMIKKAVRTLRLQFRLPIGSSKQSNEAGYFVMLTDEDQAVWAGQVLDQVRAELAVLRAAAGPKAALELLGQLQMEAQ